MAINKYKCFKVVGGNLYCTRCNSKCIKWGLTVSGEQRYRCKKCGVTRMKDYIYKAYKPEINIQIVSLLKEGCGISSISRLLKISSNTIQKRIIEISDRIKKPNIPLGKTYEMDELCTFIGKKKNRIWLAYAIRQDTKEVVDYRIGKRTNKTLKPLVQSLILSQAKRVYTDKLINYKNLFPKRIHNTKSRSTNHIERMNLTLRTHLKCLSRRTICFSKSKRMLNAIIKIYFFSINSNIDNSLLNLTNTS